ncbi:MAG: hypothetical protein IKC64_02105 [Clostridia bacterium]|nr:hypothetical protein [Clostridia bacterium]
MSKKSKGKFLRATYLSLIALVAYVAMIGLVTYAIFKEDIRNDESRIEAGSLAVTGQVTGYEGEKLNNDGVLTAYTNTSVTDIDDEADPLFNMIKTVPGAYHQVTVKINNIGDVKFDYSLEITNLVFKDDSAQDVALSEQILITVNYGTDFASEISFALSDYQNNKIDLGSLNKGANG